MGVKDLWQLLSPIGRRISIETLEGKIFAIDMSIWITQFIKAMRDEEGKMIKNAHILGTIRRILKLLYHRIRPIFVFDGETPALKKRVIQARRRTHEKHESNRNAAVHKLIIAHMKQHIKQQIETTKSKNQPESTSQYANGFVSSTEVPSVETHNSQSNSKGEEIPSILQQPSTVTDIEDDEDKINWVAGYEHLKRKHLDSESDNDAEAEEEPEWSLPDKYEDMNLEVLSSLPAHIRKGIVEDARRKERAKSRANFIPVASDPLLYSQTQLANFLNTSKLNRRFDEAQKKILGDQSGGIRIAADGKRKYMYSSKSTAITSQTTSSFAAAAKQSESILGRKSIASEDYGESGGESGEELTSRDYMIAKKEGSYQTVAQELEQKALDYDSYDENERWMRSLEEEYSYDEEDGQENDDHRDENNDETSVMRPFKRLKKGATSQLDHTSSSSIAITKENHQNIDTVDLSAEDTMIDMTINDGSSPKLETETNVIDQQEVEPQAQTMDIPVEERGFYNDLHCDSGEDEDFDDIAWESSDKPNEITGANLVNESVSVEKACVEDEAEAERKMKIFAHYLNMLSSDDEKETCDEGGDDDVIALKRSSDKLANVVNLTSVVPKPSSTVEGFPSSNLTYHSCKSTKDSLIPFITESMAPLLHVQQPITLQSDTLSRAVSTAASMADWAGRVVRKVLTEHVKSDKPLPNTASSSLVATGYNQKNELADIEILPTVSSSSSAAAAATWQKSNHVDDRTVSSSSNAHWHPLDLTVDNEDQGKSKLISHEVSLLSDRNHSLESIVLEEAVPSGLVAENSETEDAEEIKRRIIQNNRDVEKLTQEMKDEVIALIQSFDLPYIIAPYEAEAQCAVLQEIGLVDGIITEDSDAFLFGAKEVYKNIFQDQKYVEVYLAEDAKRELGLHREDLIALAYFLGSDYCEGVNGVGIVNAMEIIQAFPMHPMVTLRPYEASQLTSSNESLKYITQGLAQFKQWLQGYDVKADILSSIDQQFHKSTNKTKTKQTKQAKTKTAIKSKTKLKGKGKQNGGKSKARKTLLASSDDEEGGDADDKEESDYEEEEEEDEDEDEIEEESESNDPEIIKEVNEEQEAITENIQDKLIKFEQHHKAGRSKWKVPDSFSDQKIAQAYLEPMTNRNQAPFIWTMPNQEKIRKFCRDVLGWTDVQMDAQINPVLQRYAQRTNQTRIDQHFMTYHDDTRFAKIASDRLRQTVQQITGKSLANNDLVVTTTKPKKPTNNRKRKTAAVGDLKKK